MHTFHTFLLLPLSFGLLKLFFQKDFRQKIIFVRKRKKYAIELDFLRERWQRIPRRNYTQATCASKKKWNDCLHCHSAERLAKKHIVNKRIWLCERVSATEREKKGRESMTQKLVEWKSLLFSLPLPLALKCFHNNSFNVPPCFCCVYRLSVRNDDKLF